MEEVENRMVVDSEWDEVEYGVPSRHRITRMRQSYEEAVREDWDYERHFMPRMERSYVK